MAGTSKYGIGKSFWIVNLKGLFCVQKFVERTEKKWVIA